MENKKGLKSLNNQEETAFFWNKSQILRNVLMKCRNSKTAKKSRGEEVRRGKRERRTLQDTHRERGRRSRFF